MAALTMLRLFFLTLLTITAAGCAADGFDDDDLGGDDERDPGEEPIEEGVDARHRQEPFRPKRAPALWSRPRAPPGPGRPGLPVGARGEIVPAGALSRTRAAGVNASDAVGAQRAWTSAEAAERAAGHAR